MKKEQRMKVDCCLTFVSFPQIPFGREKKIKRREESNFFKRGIKQTSCSSPRTPESPNIAILNNDQHGVHCLPRLPAPFSCRLSSALQQKRRQHERPQRRRAPASP